jgi:hypothetical protein
VVGDGGALTSGRDGERDVHSGIVVRA